MTPADRKALCTYIRWMANELGLRDWTIDLQREPCDEENLAHISPCEGRKVAVLSIGSDFRDRPADEQRHTITHELIHCHHAAATDIIRLDTIKHLSQQAYDILFAGFKRQIEYMVDALADAIAPKMPLIDWPKKVSSGKGR